MRRMCLSVFILLMLIILPGCWDNMVINDRSFASAIGLTGGRMEGRGLPSSGTTKHHKGKSGGRRY